MKLSLAFAFAAALTLGHASNAFADEIGPPRPDDTAAVAGSPAAAPAGPSWHYRDADHAEPARRWYGWQTLMVDGISLVTTPVGVGLPGLVLAAPIVHAAHGRWSVAAGSFALRAAGMGAVMAWAASAGGRGDFAGLAVAARAIGGGVLVHGMLTAIDAAVFAYEDPPARRDMESKRAPVRIVPSGGVDPSGGFSVGVSGTL